MRRILFMSREAAANYKPGADAALVSIRDVTQEPLVPRPGWADIVDVRFADVDTADRGLELFGTSHAQAIVEFVRKNQDREELVVHCHAGYSRSAAVALFASELLGTPCFKASVVESGVAAGSLVCLPVNPREWALYNRRVLRTLENEAHGHGSAFGEIEA